MIRVGFLYFAICSKIEKMSQELLDYLHGFMTPDRIKRIDEVLALRTLHFTVVNEDVYQAHNTSAVIRSCEVFGIQQAHIIEKRFAKRLDKNIAMGAQKWVDVFRYDSTTTCIETLREKGYRIVATSPHTSANQLKDFDISRPAAFFFGTEKEGLSDLVLEEADDFIQIPMVGFTESLNISVAAAIILQNVTSRLRQSDITWQLPESAVEEKRLDWAKKSVRSLDAVLSRFHPNP